MDTVGSGHALDSTLVCSDRRAAGSFKMSSETVRENSLVSRICTLTASEEMASPPDERSATTDMRAAFASAAGLTAARLAALVI